MLIQHREAKATKREEKEAGMLLATKREEKEAGILLHLIYVTFSKEQLFNLRGGAHFPYRAYLANSGSRFSAISLLLLLRIFMFFPGR